MASATKAATGTRNSSRGAFVRGPALGAGETESVTVLPPARVEEEVFDQGRDAEDEHQDDEQPDERSEEHTSELQSLMRISYAVFCLKKKTKQENQIHTR